MAPEIVYEDKELLILNKPAGMVVNRADTTQGFETVQDWVEARFNNSGSAISSSDIAGVSDFAARGGIVHRLDKETSGLLVVAKTVETFVQMQALFKLRKVHKTYLALVHGEILGDDGLISEKVGRLPWNRERFGVMGEGREAETEFKVVGRFTGRATDAEKRKFPGRDFGFTLLELYPKTGRTHQIRVHLKSIGHPVVADEFYAGRKTAREDRTWCPRLFLHALKIEFVHPQTGKDLSVASDLPVDLSTSLKMVTRLNSSAKCNT